MSFIRDSVRDTLAVDELKGKIRDCVHIFWDTSIGYNWLNMEETKSLGTVLTYFGNLGDMSTVFHAVPYKGCCV